MPKNDDRKSIRCSFCGKHQDQVARIIAGPGAYICNECVHLCMSILDDNYDPEETLAPDIPDVIPTPGKSGRSGSVYHRPGRRQGGPVCGGIQPL